MGKVLTLARPLRKVGWINNHGAVMESILL